MTTITVKVQSDHLEQLAKVQKPIIAIEELIWNALDADATQVKVIFDYSNTGALSKIIVSDNGHGLPHDQAISTFEKLGGSWKRTTRRTATKHRVLHGQLGRGRFRAFALGKSVKWTTCVKAGAEILEYQITGRKSDLGIFEIDDPSASTKKTTGTRVEITGLEKNFGSLISLDAHSEIAQRFALYLRKYPDATLFYDGREVDPSHAELCSNDYPIESLKLPDGRTVQLSLTIIEWKWPTDRALFLCDAAGFAQAEIPPGIQAPGYNFTAYLKSDHLRELNEQNALVMETLHPELKPMLDAAKDKMREHFRRRTAESAISVLEQWKREDLYPFKGDPKDILEETERQIFDVVALSVHTYVPDFERVDARSKKLSFRLLKQALEDSPAAVRRILQDVIELPSEKQEEFAELLEKTLSRPLSTRRRPLPTDWIL